MAQLTELWGGLGTGQRGRPVPSKRQDPGKPGFLAVTWIHRIAESHWLWLM